jgi:hypothetical protein
MKPGVNPYQINDLAALQSRAGAKIAGAIQHASARTGVDFSYLLKQANVESSFRADAKAKTSSASGLFQFIESTWLSMVNKYGDKYGLSEHAAKISDNNKVASKAARQEILELRKDPKLASLMAAEYASENKNYLESKIGGNVGSTELYMAHFMGPGGAAQFLQEMQSNPDAKGSKLFYREACSNPAIFYNKDGSSKTLGQIYAHFDTKFSGSGTTKPSSAPAAIQVADVQPTPAKGKGQFEAFNENTGQWFKTNNKIFAPQGAQYAALETRHPGRIPGYQTLMVNPVDVMALLEYGQPSDKNRKQGSLWG